MSTPTLTPAPSVDSTSATTATFNSLQADASSVDSTSATTAGFPDEDLHVITIPASDGLADSEPVHHVISASSYAADITDPAADTCAARTDSTGPGPALLGMLLAMIAVGAFLTQFTESGREVVLAVMLISGLATAGITQVLALRARIHP
ncbi:hypothetical protein F7P69_19420 [Cellulosimicrobium funkei]|nr:hypothetical protein [Cellulosimicrobium funkei]